VDEVAGYHLLISVMTFMTRRYDRQRDRARVWEVWTVVWLDGWAGRIRAAFEHPNRFARDTLLVVAGVSVVVLAAHVWQLLATPGYLAAAWGTDIDYYLVATRHWVASGSLYYPFQLAGPYDYHSGVLYPPTALLLFVPFTVLPLALWWVIPLGSTAAVVWSDRPGRWYWPLLLACFAFPMTVTDIVNGNPLMWLVAAVALACRYDWPAVLVALKPSVFPFALIGIRHRSWWLAAVALAVVSAAMLPLWTDYVRVIANERGAGLLYSAKDVPFLFLPLVSRFAARQGDLGASRKG
jgi:hypothetical protein